MLKIDTVLDSNNETGLLIVIVTAQLPAMAEAESTTTTLSDDTMLQDDAASEQTVAEQL